MTRDSSSLAVQRRATHFYGQNLSAPQQMSMKTKFNNKRLMKFSDKDEKKRSLNNKRLMKCSVKDGNNLRRS
jgi:hypothetical protein